MFLAFGTDIGQKREENQDRVRVEVLGDNMCIAAVCDGMGGNSGDFYRNSALRGCRA